MEQQVGRDKPAKELEQFEKEQQVENGRSADADDLQDANLDKSVPLNVDASLPSPSSKICHNIANTVTVSPPPLDKTILEKTTHRQIQVVKQFPSPIFDEKYVSPRRASKRLRQYTVEDYDIEHKQAFPDQHCGKGMQVSFFNFKQESTSVTIASRATNIDSLEVQNLPRNDYDNLSRAIVSKILENIEKSANGEIRITDDRNTIRCVSKMLEGFVTRSHSNFVSREETAESKLAFNAQYKNIVSNEKAGPFQQKVSRSKKKSNPLPFSDQDYYSKIVPIDIVTRLRDKKLQCAADNTTKEGRCGHSPANGDAALKLLQKLEDLLTSEQVEFARAAECLKGIVENAFCKNTHRKTITGRWAELCRRFAPSVDDEDNLEREAERVQLALWLSQLIKPLASNASAISKDVSISFLFGEKVPDLEAQGHEVMLFTFPGRSLARRLQPFIWNQKDRNLAPKALIRKTALSNLTPGDKQRKGGIYMFWHEGNFGWVKIGKTQEDTAGRVNQWAAQCGFAASEHVTKATLGNQVSHPLRVEKLIHAELKNERYLLAECPGCGKEHIEWFRIDVKIAQAIVNKWTGWMQGCNPYDEDGKLRTDVAIPPISQRKAEVILTPVKRKELRRSSRIKEQLASRVSK